LANFAFPRRARLTKTDDFSSVFNFRKRLNGRYLSINYRHNQLTLPRLGIVVGKKTACLAVQRNYMKRVLRELFRTQRCHLPPVDLVIRPQTSFKHTDYPAIRQEFDDLLARLRRLPPPPGRSN
jgi:ribonuclease P protein component